MRSSPVWWAGLDGKQYRFRDVDGSVSLLTTRRVTFTALQRDKTLGASRFHVPNVDLAYTASECCSRRGQSKVSSATRPNMYCQSFYLGRKISVAKPEANNLAIGNSS